MRALLAAACLALSACAPAVTAETTPEVAAPAATASAPLATVTTTTTGPVPATTSTAATPSFSATATRVSSDDLPTSWRPGCPVGPDDLRQVALTHWTFGGPPRTGTIVVHEDVVDEVVDVFEVLFELRFPIERIVPVDAYGGDDDRSMAANNTSAFNCRAVTGGSAWSQHSFGRAIDLNPVQNPYVRGVVLPPTGAAFLDRTDHRPGMVTDEVVAAFAAAGWRWGGDWSSPDYQHFSKTGR